MQELSQEELQKLREGMPEELKQTLAKRNHFPPASIEISLSITAEDGFVVMTVGDKPVSLTVEVARKLAIVLRNTANQVEKRMISQAATTNKNVGRKRH